MADEDQTGFEFRGEFFPFTVNIDNGKDLMLIDRITAMPVEDFQQALNDIDSLGRGPLLMAILATSIRAKHPAWTVEKIMRLVESDLSTLDFIVPDTGEVIPADPPAPAGEEPAQNSEPGTSPSDGSSSSPTPEENSSSATLYAIPV